MLLEELTSQSEVMNDVLIRVANLKKYLGIDHIQRELATVSFSPQFSRENDRDYNNPFSQRETRPADWNWCRVNLHFFDESETGDRFIPAGITPVKIVTALRFSEPSLLTDLVNNFKFFDVKEIEIHHYSIDIALVYLLDNRQERGEERNANEAAGGEGQMFAVEAMPNMPAGIPR